MRVVWAFLRRTGTALLVLFGVSILIFVIARVIPGDPARVALGPNATADQVAALRLALRLDDPVPLQYLHYMAGLVRGDLGISLYTNRPVTTDIAQFLPASLELIFTAGLLMVAIGLPLGIIAARFRGRWPDHVVRVVSLTGVSAPSFVWAVAFMLIFGYWLKWFPISQRLHDSFQVAPVTGFLLIDTLLAGDGAAWRDAARHLVLPAFALALAGIGQAARLTRANMIETYDRPYIEMARAFGFAPGRIARRYAFRPSLIPSLTIIGLDFAAMLGSAFLVEQVFGWPGLSRYGVQVILRKDLNAIVGTVLVIAAMFILVNIIVDLLTVLFNPRIRLAKGGKA
ncbi:MAG: ABC transporter permease [Rubellimicrobium sp.]|nr:ABC transporter permease [Rubellimicrobium sp.]